MSDFEYEILNYWNDNNDLYVDYLVTNKKTDENAHACTLLKVSDIKDYSRSLDITDELVDIISKNNGKEFKLPKTSELHNITYHIFKELCDSDNNMVYITNKDDMDLFNITIENYEKLCEDIEKFNLQDYFDNYPKNITVYGGLQCCFNDDRIVERNIEYER